MSVAAYRYLIVGGTTKAATTSMFAWLAAHPDVCAASSKETRFFLDDDYPLPVPTRMSETGPEGYAVFFGNCREGAVRMEATPDYLYSPGTPARIRDTLPNARLVFLLRNPVDRFVSWHRFAIQNNAVPKTTTLEEYLAAQVDPPATDTPQALRALEQGHYAKYLAPFQQALGKDRVLVIYMEDLAADPRAALGRVCAIAGLDPAFFDTFEFKAENKTVSLKHPWVHWVYMRTRYHVRRFSHSRPWIHRWLRAARHKLEPIYLRMNAAPEEHAPPTAATLQRLREYYAGEPAALEALVATRPQWFSSTKGSART